MSAAGGAAGAAGSSTFLPVLLLALAVTGWAAFQTTQLAIERGNLGEAIDKQDAQVEQSRQVRTRLESIATSVALLAREGNANATVMVEELRKRGITINPDGPAPQPPP